jgi:hypothetical protein
MSRATYSAIGAGGALLAIVVFAWVDTIVIRDARRLAASTLEPTQANGLTALSSVALAATILGLAVAAWRSRSAFVGGLYAMVGAILAFLPVIFLTLAVERDGAPPVLPGALAGLLSDLAFFTLGPMNAVGLLGAAMLVIGLAALVRSAREPQLADDHEGNTH